MSVNAINTQNTQNLETKSLAETKEENATGNIFEDVANNFLEGGLIGLAVRHADAIKYSFASDLLEEYEAAVNGETDKENASGNAFEDVANNFLEGGLIGLAVRHADAIKYSFASDLLEGYEATVNGETDKENANGNAFEDAVNYFLEGGLIGHAVRNADGIKYSCASDLLEGYEAAVNGETKEANEDTNIYKRTKGISSKISTMADLASQMGHKITQSFKSLFE